MKLSDLRNEVSKRADAERSKERQEATYIDRIYVKRGVGSVEYLSEGKTYSGRFPRNIRQDEPTHGVGFTHAHVHDRKGREIGVVRIDGTGSHGSKFRLHPKDREVLVGRGFDISQDGFVEWRLIEIADLEALFG
jgi:hypothetical protein